MAAPPDTAAIADDFQGRKVVVSGASGALGTAVVARLLEAGAKVYAPCFEAEVPAALAGRARLEAHAGIDLADAAAADRYYAEHFEGSEAPLWASVHLAGGFAMGGIVECSAAELSRLLSLNFLTCFNACRAATRHMRAGGRGGQIVNVSAKPALEASAGAGMAAYASCKAAVAGLTRALGAELAPEGIFVNAIAPSIIDTPANRAAMPEVDTRAWPKVEELASTISNLAAPSNKVLRGAVLPVYGRS